jgi:hypothetical protein
VRQSRNTISISSSSFIATLSNVKLLPLLSQRAVYPIDISSNPSSSHRRASSSIRHHVWSIILLSEAEEGGAGGTRRFFRRGVSGAHICAFRRIANIPRRHEGLKKTELEIALEDHLNSNASKYSSDPKFASFYNNRRSASSPVKKEASSALSDVETKVKAVRRRVTKAAEELLTT